MQISWMSDTCNVELQLPVTKVTMGVAKKQPGGNLVDYNVKRNMLMISQMMSHT